VRFTGHSRIVGLLYETFFMSPFWHPEFGSGSKIFGKFVDLCTKWFVLIIRYKEAPYTIGMAFK